MIGTAAGCDARDPAGIAGPGGDLPVQACRVLGDDKGKAGPGELQIGLIDLSRLLLLLTNGDRNIRRLQLLAALAVDQRVWVQQGHMDLSDICRNDG